MSFRVTVKFQKELLDITTEPTATLLELKNILFDKTCVPVSRQKLVGIKTTLPPHELDGQQLQNISMPKVRDSFQIMLLGNPEVKILKEPDPTQLSNIVDDFEFD